MKPIGDRLEAAEPPPLRRKRGAPEASFGAAFAAAAPPRPREPGPPREVGAPDLERAVLDWLAVADVQLGPAGAAGPAPAAPTPTAPRAIEVPEITEVVEIAPFPDLAEPALEVELEIYEPPDPEPPLSALIAAWHRSLPQVELAAPDAPIDAPVMTAPAPVEMAIELAREIAPAVAIDEVEDVDAIDGIDEPRGVIGPKFARVTVGEGDTRVELTVATAGHTVRVTAVAEDVRLAHAIGQGADDLAEGLARHGLELGDLRAGHGDRDLHEPEPDEPEPRDDDDVQYAGVRAIC